MEILVPGVDVARNLAFPALVLGANAGDFGGFRALHGEEYIMTPTA